MTTGTNANLVWPFPIGSPPRVLHLGTPVHGDVPVEQWRNLGFWCLHSYRYTARLRLNETWFDLKPGMVSIIPPGIDIEFQYTGPSPHTFAHFHLARSPSAEVPVVGAVMDLGPKFESFDHAFRECVGWQPMQPARTQSRIWDLLWQLTAKSTEVGTTREKNPLLDQATRWIELRLSQSFRIGALARELDISHAHLVRLFRHHLDVSPLAYVRTRRAERAEHLLRFTTLPVKSIASQVGMADLQQLNKCLRRTVGKSPRAIRFSRP